MKTATTKISYLFLFSLIILGGCKKNEKSIASQANVIKVPNVVYKASIWRADSVYVINGEIEIDAPLTIEAGTVIKFEKEATLKFTWNGNIKAIGTESQPIIFTSIKDDINGDTNGDLHKSEPLAADWNGMVVFNNNAKSIFSHCKFMYGGCSIYGVLEFSGEADVQNCVFSNNSIWDNSDYRGALNLTHANSSSIVKNNEFYNNIIPLSINPEINIDNSNSFSNKLDINQTNKFNGIFVTGYQSTLSVNTKWEESEVAFVVCNRLLSILGSSNLILGDNVVLKFLKDGVLEVGRESHIINYDGEGVYFTSYSDDSLKGDTNGDDHLMPAADDSWLGVLDFVNYKYFNWPNILNTTPI